MGGTTSRKDYDKKKRIKEPTKEILNERLKQFIDAQKKETKENLDNLKKFYRNINIKEILNNLDKYQELYDKFNFKDSKDSKDYNDIKKNFSEINQIKKKINKYLEDNKNIIKIENDKNDKIINLLNNLFNAINSNNSEEFKKYNDEFKNMYNIDEKGKQAQKVKQNKKKAKKAKEEDELKNRTKLKEILDKLDQEIKKNAKIFDSIKTEIDEVKYDEITKIQNNIYNNINNIIFDIDIKTHVLNKIYSEHIIRFKIIKNIEIIDIHNFEIKNFSYLLESYYFFRDVLGFADSFWVDYDRVKILSMEDMNGKLLYINPYLEQKFKSNKNFNLNRKTLCSLKLMPPDSLLNLKDAKSKDTKSEDTKLYEKYKDFREKMRRYIACNANEKEEDCKEDYIKENNKQNKHKLKLIYLFFQQALLIIIMRIIFMFIIAIYPSHPKFISLIKNNQIILFCCINQSTEYKLKNGKFYNMSSNYIQDKKGIIFNLNFETSLLSINRCSLE